MIICRIWLFLAGVIFGLLIAIALPARASDRNFPRPALAYVLVHEGGFSNNPNDRGGVTLEGVTQKVYDAARADKGLPRRALAPEMRGQPEWIKERNDIYRWRFWLPCAGDKLPAGLDYAVFDWCVNAGVKQASKHLRRALNLPEEDWLITPDVLSQVRRTHVPSLLRDLYAIRVKFYRALCTARAAQCGFLPGWLARAATGEALALKLNNPRLGGLAAFDLKPALGPGKAFAEDETEEEAR